MLYRTKVLNCDPLAVGMANYDFLKALDCSMPECMFPGYGLSQTIMIRSLLSGDVKR